MNELQQLIHTLDVSEKKSLHYFIKCLGSKSNSGLKLFNLFQILLKLNTAPSAEYLIKKLALKDKASLNVLTFRLKHKIYDFLILDNNLEKTKQLDKLNYTSLRLRKKLTQLNYLIRNKGTIKLLESELNSLINESIKYEVYNIAIDALQFKKQIFTRKKGLKEFFKINQQIEILKEKEKNINNAIDFQLYFVAQNETKNNLSFTEKNKLLTEKIIELNEAHKKNPSNFLKYFIHILENYYYIINENYNTAREVCLENLKLIINSASLFNKQRIGATYIDLFTIDINLKEYKRAMNNINYALKYFPKYSLNYYKTIESKMMVNCYLKKYKSALNDIKELNKLSSIKFPVQFEKLKYYQASVLFQNNELSKANKITASGINLPINEDGMEVYLRLLQICIFISLKKLILAIQHTENLLRHYKRYYSNKYKNERLSNLVLLFKNLSKQDFTDIELNEKLNKIFNVLLNDKKCRWEPLSPELFPIDEWIINYYQLKLNPIKTNDKISTKTNSKISSKKLILNIIH